MNHPPGIDVVDLRAAANRRSANNPGFARRVLGASEWTAYDDAGCPAHLLWLLWSAKEAAYKSLSRDGTLVFSHRRFEVRPESWRALGELSGQAAGVVVHGDQEVPVRWRWTEDHALCTGGSALDDVRACVRDIDAVRTEHPRYLTMPDQSRAARALLHEVLARWPALPAALWVSRQARHAPQLVLEDAIWPGAQISLSHDGRYVAAAAILCPSQTTHRQV